MEGGWDGSCCQGEKQRSATPCCLKSCGLCHDPSILQGRVPNANTSRLSGKSPNLHVVTSGSVLFARAWSIQKRMVGIKKDRWGWSTCTEVPTTSVRCRSNIPYPPVEEAFTVPLRTKVPELDFVPKLSATFTTTPPPSLSSSSSSSSLTYWLTDLLTDLSGWPDWLTHSLTRSLTHCQTLSATTSAASNR